MPNNEMPKPLDASFKIQLTMISDWHIGSGTGRPGDVDRLVRRDEDGLPFIPAKTLTGIWRDGCERAALGLDNGTPGVWSRWIPFLFGDQAGQPEEEAHVTPKAQLELPRPAIVSVRSARFPETLRKAIKGQPVVKDAVTFVKPGVAIDPRSGRALEKHLRFEEMARGGVTLTTQGSIDLSGCSAEQQHAATALLLAGAKLVERIGAKRRRGAGHCEMKIKDFEVSNWLATLGTDNTAAPPDPKKPELFTLQTTKADAEWVCANLRLTAKTPLIVSEQTIGNLIKTLDYIPGTYLLPIIRRKLKAQFKEECDINSAIFSGQLIVTNATIAVDSAPGRPVPFALFHEKVDGGLKLGKGVYNRLQEEAPDKPQLKGHRSGYIGVSPNDENLPSGEKKKLPAYKTAALEVEPHNVVEDKYQRPNEAVGGVYSYEVIPQGIELCAQLRVRKSLLEAPDSDWCAALNGDCKIGRSKKDDYGLVKLQASKAEGEVTKPALNNELTVWLLSDVLLRDERLRPTAAVHRLAKELGEKSGVRLTVRQPANPKLMSALSRTHRTDSWHVGWGLPRPSLVGLAAGTCVVFKVEGAIDASKLANIAAEGIGERRAEGYGRLCFNDPLMLSAANGRGRKDPKLPNDPIPVPIKKDAVPKEEYDYAETIECEAARKELQRCAMGLAADPKRREHALGIYIKPIDGKPKSEPTLSQLGTLRSALNRLKQAGNKQTLLNWLDHLKEKGEGKWPEGRNSEEHSLNKIRNLIADEKYVWAKLQANFDRLTLTEKGVDKLKEKLWAEAVRTLVDACIRAQKRDTEPKNNSKKGAQPDGTQN